MITIALRALYPKPNSTDSILSTTVIDRDRGEVGYQISAGNGDGGKVNKLAAEKSSALTSMLSPYSGVAVEQEAGRGLALRMQGSSPASPGSYSFREDPKLFALFAPHESRRT